MVKIRSRGILAIVIVLLCLIGLIFYWTRPVGPPPPFIMKPRSEPSGVLQRPNVPIPLDPRIGNVQLMLDGKTCGDTPITLPAGKLVSVSGRVEPSSNMPIGASLESVVLGLGHRDRNRIGWTVIGDTAISGPGTPTKDRGTIRHLEDTWPVPKVKGELTLVLFVTVTEPGKIRPLHIAATYPVVIE